MKRKQETCRCNAYPFPHRKDGGKCDQYTREEEEAGETWKEFTRKQYLSNIIYPNLRSLQ